MDWFGVCVLAAVTALGGGTMRDTLLGHYPLSWVKDPTLLLVACGAALVTIAVARFMETLRWPFLHPRCARAGGVHHHRLQRRDRDGAVAGDRHRRQG